MKRCYINIFTNDFKQKNHFFFKLAQDSEEKNQQSWNKNIHEKFRFLYEFRFERIKQWQNYRDFCFVTIQYTWRSTRGFMSRVYGAGATARRAHRDTLDQYGQERTKLATM